MRREVTRALTHKAPQARIDSISRDHRCARFTCAELPFTRKRMANLLETKSCNRESESRLRFNLKRLIVAPKTAQRKYSASVYSVNPFQYMLSAYRLRVVRIFLFYGFSQAVRAPKWQTKFELANRERHSA